VPQPVDRNFGRHRDRGGVEVIYYRGPDEGEADDGAAVLVDDGLCPPGVTVCLQLGASWPITITSKMSLSFGMKALG
jgi:hypothetical protein